MKIGPSSLADLAAAKPGESSPADAAARELRPGGHAGPHPSGVRHGDRVTLSHVGSSVSRLAAAAASASDDFDATKVHAIQSAIREGRFSVNSEAIAERLIAEAAAMITSRPQ